MSAPCLHRRPAPRTRRLACIALICVNTALGAGCSRSVVLGPHDVARHNDAAWKITSEPAASSPAATTKTPSSPARAATADASPAPASTPPPAAPSDASPAPSTPPGGAAALPPLPAPTLK